MRCLIVGLGNQGRKRQTGVGQDLMATVDPVVDGASHRAIDDVPVDAYDAALVCTPENVKVSTVRYLLERRKHVLVEKPLLASNEELLGLDTLARVARVACYTAYNHRFEPQINRLKQALLTDALGKLYLAKFYYGNGTARDVFESPWRDQGLGVLSDLGSHLLDLSLYLFDGSPHRFTLWNSSTHENRSIDHCLFGSEGTPTVFMEASLLSWKNSFSIDVYGSEGSAHVGGLCKWGPSSFTLRRRVLPSGKPAEETTTVEKPDPTWAAEYEYFRYLCRTGGSTIPNDIFINDCLQSMRAEVSTGVAA